MKSLFSPEGSARLDETMGQRLLSAFDFDGTLAPIQPRPEQVLLPDDIRQRLRVLAEYSPIAIITGRSVADISSRLGFTPDFIVGNHGLEGVPGWDAQAAYHEALCAGWHKRVAAALGDPEFGRGLLLEDKRYSLSVHYREAPDPQQAATRLQALFDNLSPRPRVVAGKYVFNLLAHDACNKGSALEQLMHTCGARHAIYVGDDVTDEDVFRLRRPDILAVRIEHATESAADFFLPQPEEILWLLDELIGRLRAAGARNWLQTETASSA
jgi:trehalose 6-phosphate phosphatase